MEANSATGCMVLAEYHQLFTNLTNRRASLPPDDQMRPFLDACWERTKTYYEEALGCNTLTMAAVLNPVLRLRFFDHILEPEDDTIPRVKDNLHAEFNQRKIDLNLPFDSKSSPSPEHESAEVPAIFRLYQSEQPSVSNELDLYLKGTDPLVFPDIENSPNRVLKWWKVCFLQG